MLKNQSVEVKVMTIADLDSVYAFEMSLISGEGIEKEMKAWHAPWRKEALEQYLPLGWSFLRRNEGVIEGYILAQPLLFFQGWTQSLWIEHVQASSEAIGVELIEIAYRWARDKHLQKVFFNTNLNYIQVAEFAKKEAPLSIGQYSTTKI